MSPCKPMVVAGGSDPLPAANMVPDRAHPPLSSHFSLWCMQAFVAAAVVGTMFVLFAPVAFVRVLGVVALVGGLLGLLLHGQLLRRDHPAAWAAFRGRLAPDMGNALRDRWRASAMASGPGHERDLPASARASGD
jgi:hypothetical protein